MARRSRPSGPSTHCSATRRVPPGSRVGCARRWSGARARRRPRCPRTVADCLPDAVVDLQAASPPRRITALPRDGPGPRRADHALVVTASTRRVVAPLGPDTMLEPVAATVDTVLDAHRALRPGGDADPADAVLDERRRASRTVAPRAPTPARGSCSARCTSTPNAVGADPQAARRGGARAVGSPRRPRSGALPGGPGGRARGRPLVDQAARLGAAERHGRGAPDARRVGRRRLGRARAARRVAGRARRSGPRRASGSSPTCRCTRPRTASSSSRRRSWPGTSGRRPPIAAGDGRRAAGALPGAALRRADRGARGGRGCPPGSISIGCAHPSSPPAGDASDEPSRDPR